MSDMLIFFVPGNKSLSDWALTGLRVYPARTYWVSTSVLVCDYPLRIT